jgi:hypothetical protein
LRTCTNLGALTRFGCVWRALRKLERCWETLVAEDETTLTTAKKREEENREQREELRATE